MQRDSGVEGPAGDSPSLFHSQTPLSTAWTLNSQESPPPALACPPVHDGGTWSPHFPNGRMEDACFTSDCRHTFETHSGPFLSPGRCNLRP